MIFRTIDDPLLPLCALYARREEPRNRWPPTTPTPAPKPANEQSPRRPRNTPPLDPSKANIQEAAWERFTPFLAFPPQLRRVIYTTNSIESLNYQLRKVTKNRGHFPNDDAVVKLLWLAICNIEDKRARDRERDRGKKGSERKAQGRLVEGQVVTNWKQALAQLAIAYPDRINPHL